MSDWYVRVESMAAEAQSTGGVSAALCSPSMFTRIKMEMKRNVKFDSGITAPPLSYKPLTPAFNPTINIFDYENPDPARSYKMIKSGKMLKGGPQPQHPRPNPSIIIQPQSIIIQDD